MEVYIMDMWKESKGLTPRAYFAGQYAIGLASQYKINRHEDKQILAQMAVELADALIAELNRED